VLYKIIFSKKLNLFWTRTLFLYMSLINIFVFILQLLTKPLRNNRLRRKRKLVTNTISQKFKKAKH